MLLRADIRRASDNLLNDGVVCYPTEGVFGLGCLPLAETAVDRILDIKGRSVTQGLILIGADLEQLLPWIDPTEEELASLQMPADRPTTWVITCSELTPDWVTGGRNTVAVRICGHPVARKLCLAVGSAIISTSANRSGRPAVETAVRARYLLGKAVDTVVSGQTDPTLGPSTIRLASSGEVVRGT